MKHTQESIAAELKRIQSGVPEALRKAVLVEKKVTPDVEFVMKKAVESKDIDVKKRKRIQNLLDTGIFSRTSMEDNPKVAKQIDNYIKREINKSIKAGRLPKKPPKYEKSKN